MRLGGGRDTMQARWYGHSAFALSGATGVFIDPFVPERVRAEFGDPFDYPPITGVEPDLVLVSHEHIDHNGSEAISGTPFVLRGGCFETPVHEKTGLRRFETPVGEVTGISSDHGEGGGPNTIFAFTLDDLGICHFGDFGQQELHPWQKQAIGQPAMLFIPVGDHYTIDGKTAARITKQLVPQLVIPMHYRTPKAEWERFETAEAFLDELAFATTVKLDTPAFNPEEHIRSEELTVLVPALP
jgi:L-ascorbate metabolism protein UlaG (beta-lactamase superfamily)